ncbi:ATP-binding protein [Flavobacterium sp. J372]|uniref:tetratricopeptide repeat-containing sensor histidine kinase n=1 Tax=Flavobacterium sp. J372 TaxID=2898436 RepID=UPI002150A544|nr:tetratricopeptide repeat-containing sensor histidine kinase [Flavobacterium sp. J372]MCR5861516.1 ATP-binding protein [Flavobacterium sp. J372]
MNISVKAFVLFCFIITFVSCENKVGQDSGLGNRINELIDRSQNDSLNIGVRQKILDSAYSELEDYKNDTVTRYLYRRLSAAYYNLDLYGKAVTSARTTLNRGIEAKDSLSMARAYYYLADAHYGKGQLDSAFTYYSQAQKLYTEINDLGTLGEVLLYKAYIYYDLGEYALCETAAARALPLLQNENKIVHVYNCYNLIATSLDGLNDNQEALKYYELALRQLDGFRAEGYTDNDINLYKASCYNNMGGVYVKIKANWRAIQLYNEALTTNNLKEEVPALYAKLLNNLAYAKLKNGDDSDLPQLFFRSLNLRKELNNKSGIVASNIYLGEYYIAKRDTVKAVNYLKAAFAGATEIESNSEILSSLELLSAIDPKNANDYNSKRFDILKKLQIKAEQNKDKFARIEYETDKLEIEKEELAKTNNLIIVVSAVALLLIGAIFMIYYLNARNKKLLLIQQQQKANEEIYQLMFDQQHKIDEARSEEKNRIAMELHDGILNNIYAVRLNLEFINKKTDEESVTRRKEFIRELQNVESEIRGVSHDLSRNSVFHAERTFKTLLEFMINSQKNADETIFETNIDDSINWDNYNNVVKANIYRIIQEAIQNINKYSKAKHAAITVSEANGNIEVVIKDDGIGFDPDKIKGGGIGLRNLRKRAAALNGSINITSQPGNGASVKVIFPAA